MASLVIDNMRMPYTSSSIMFVFRAIVCAFSQFTRIRRVLSNSV